MYKKKFYKKKKFVPRRRYKRTNVQSLVKKTVHKELNRNLETKFTMTALTGNIGNSANFNRIATPGVGTSDSDRTADTIMIKSLYIDYSFIADDSTNLIRFIVFQWYQDSSLNPPIAASILESSSFSQVQAPYSMNNAQNYRILYDRTHTLSTAGSNEVIHVKKYLTKIPCRKLVFTNSSANSANIKKGQIYVLEVSDSALSGPALSCVCKLNYTDA